MIESILIALGVLGSGGVYYFMNKRVNVLESKVSKAESEAIVAKGYQQNAQENVEKLKEKHQNFIKNIKVQMNQKLVELEEKYKREAPHELLKVTHRRDSSPDENMQFILRYSGEIITITYEANCELFIVDSGLRIDVYEEDEDG